MAENKSTRDALLKNGYLFPCEAEIQLGDTPVGQLFSATDELSLGAQIEIASNLMFARHNQDPGDMEARLAYLFLRRCRGILEQNPKAAQLKMSWD